MGMRRREAQSRCPGLEVVPQELAAEARNWEPAVAAVEAFAPGVEVLGPGRLALGSRGPSRYFGGDMALAVKVSAAVEAAVAGEGGPWAGCCRVGVADGLFAAGLAAARVAARVPAGHAPAAQMAAHRAGQQAPVAPVAKPVVVPRGRSAEFLAPMPLRVLALAGLAGLGGLGAPAGPAGPGGRNRRGAAQQGAPEAGFADLVDLLGRLGLKTLGDFAALPAPTVLGRFGAGGLLAHRLARGLDERPVRSRLPPPDWVVAAELDPPADQLQAAVFVGRALAEELHGRLTASGLVCTRLAIEAETEHGTTHRRSWRHDGALSAAAIGERVRWQLEGWAQAGQALGQPGQGVEAAQAGRITRLVLVPEEVRPDVGRQLGFWGQDAGAAGRAARALARVQGLLGPEAALTATLQGGRDYHEQVFFVPWGEPRVPLRSGLPPWPGRLPGLAPTVVHRTPLAAQVMDVEGNPLSVAGRGALSGRPGWVTVGHGPRLAVEAWSGPWPLEERWWEAGGRRRARLQVLTAGGAAYLLAREDRRWWVEATYD